MKEYWKPKKTNRNFRTKCQWVCKLFVLSQQQQKKQKRSEWPSQRGGCWNVCSTWFWWCYFQPMLNNMFDTTLKSLSIPVAVVRSHFCILPSVRLSVALLSFIPTNYPSQTKFYVFFTILLFTIISYLVFLLEMSNSYPLAICGKENKSRPFWSLSHVLLLFNIHLSRE